MAAWHDRAQIHTVRNLPLSPLKTGELGWPMLHLKQSVRGARRTLITRLQPHPSRRAQFCSKAQQPHCYYLHVGPSGDFWTGHEVFAAKHLQPDYVKSVALPEGWTEESPKTEALIALLDENPSLLHRIYDTGVIDRNLLQEDDEAHSLESMSRKDDP